MLTFLRRLLGLWLLVAGLVLWPVEVLVRLPRALLTWTRPAPRQTAALIVIGWQTLVWP